MRDDLRQQRLQPLCSKGASAKVIQTNKFADVNDTSLIARPTPASGASFRLALLVSHSCKYSPLLSAGAPLYLTWTVQ
ncbi:hypothetical protein Y032_0417g1094 [Ancylostoma ceylanicum]|uniref:Uncharacterized protein n=1 Tax=Ancylostoma ceylanicum TaxID=53326 RepID=A0A016X0Z9_9BILA|nr:hypothetical protein Y032_0417g1094 [Ancylostoma ceylanicum]